MKRILVVLLGLAIWAAAAGTASGVDFGLFGSYWDTKDGDETFGGGAKLRLGILDLRASYFQDVTADVDPEIFDVEISAIPLEAGLVFEFAKSSPIRPYIGGGVGYYLLDVENGEIDDEAGFYGVAGANIGNPKGLSFNVEAMYRDIDATVRGDFDLDDLPDLEDEVGLDLSGLGINAGVVWRF